MLAPEAKGGKAKDGCHPNKEQQKVNIAMAIAYSFLSAREYQLFQYHPFGVKQQTPPI